MTGDELIALVAALPPDVRSRPLEIVVETLPRETFTRLEVGPADKNDIAMSRDPETTRNSLVVFVSG